MALPNFASAKSQLDSLDIFKRSLIGPSLRLFGTGFLEIWKACRGFFSKQSELPENPAAAPFACLATTLLNTLLKRKLRDQVNGTKDENSK